MSLSSIKTQLQNESIFLEEGIFFERPSAMGYHKQFKWAWMATQLNTFFIATDFGEDPITIAVIEDHINHSFKYANKNYKGWPKGLQAGMGVITFLIGSNIENDAIEYCRQLKTGKKWAGFSIPVIIDLKNNEVIQFERTPMWGKIYYPYFKQMISVLTS